MNIRQMLMQPVLIGKGEEKRHRHNRYQSSIIFIFSWSNPADEMSPGDRGRTCKLQFESFIQLLIWLRLVVNLQQCTPKKNVCLAGPNRGWENEFKEINWCLLWISDRRRWRRAYWQKWIKKKNTYRDHHPIIFIFSCFNPADKMSPCELNFSY